MKLSQIVKGKRAERSVEVPLQSGERPSCIVVPLNGTEESIALSFALSFAKGKGVESPAPGNPLYDLGYMVKVLELSYLDPDSPAEARTAFFDGGPEQILKELHRETIPYLFEVQQGWQDECAPLVRKLGAEQLLLKVQEIAEAEDPGPFEELRPGLRWSLVRIIARLYLSSLTPSSPSGLPTEADLRTSSSAGASS